MIWRLRRCFTLIECLVVISVLSILAALLFPALRLALENAGGTLCASSVRQVSVIGAQYADMFYGMMPLGTDGEGREPVTNKWIHKYWLDFYMAAGLEEAENGKIHCPKVKVGAYGMTNDIGAGGFTVYPYGKDYSTDPYSFIGCRVSRITSPSNVVFFADAGRQYFSDGSAQLKLDSGGKTQMGGWTFGNSYIYYSGYYQGVWLAHGGAANLSFADGHVESGTPTRLLRAENPNKYSSLGKKGVAVFWDNAGVAMCLK